MSAPLRWTHTLASGSAWALLIATLGCTDETDAEPSQRPTPTCSGGQFGRPTSATGLTSAQCGPSCECGAPWTAPNFDAAFVARLRSASLTTPPPRLSDNPYDAEPPPKPGGFCAVVPEPTGYALADFVTEGDAAQAGATVTHAGGCGACSSLQDLATYIEFPDLTTPVRECGLKGLNDPAQVEPCIAALGFSPACAQIWAFNTEHTRQRCLQSCLDALDDPYNLPDGALNPCLQCDEDESGPVFKAVAGRTRRNSGLPTAICRPCDGVFRSHHAYPDDVY